MLIELIADTAASLGGLGGFLLIKQWWNGRNEKTSGVYLWKQVCDKGRDRQFRCPKCSADITMRCKICRCDQYHNEHYHFACRDEDNYYDRQRCGYECIVRAKDDR